MQVKLVSSGAFLTLLNGSNIVYYSVPPTASTVVRMAAAINAQANGLSTGGYDILVYLANSNGTNVVASRILVVDETGSAFGAGFNVAGLQRMYFMTGGNNSVLITEGDGSAAYYKRNLSSDPFITPGGTSATLVFINQLGGYYRRTYLDGSFIEFFTDGRMSKAVDRFGNTTTYGWTGSLLTGITDPMSKTTILAYTTAKIDSLRDPGNRVTQYAVTSGRLTTVTDPDGISTTLGYIATTNQLTSVTDRGGNSTNFTYDAMARVDSVLAPQVTIYTGAAVRPTTLLKSADRVVWQPATAGTSAGTAKPFVLPDSARATITNPQNAVVRSTLDRFGSPLRLVGVYNEATVITRDTLSRPTLVVEPTGHTIQLFYSNGSEPYANYSPYHLLQSKDVTTGRTINYTYTTLNDVATVLGDIPGWSFTYHNGAQGPTGAVKTITLAGGLPETHYPNVRGQDTLIVHSDTMHKERLTYDPGTGNVLTSRDPRGDITSNHYDILGRPDTTWVPHTGKFSTTFNVLNDVIQTVAPLSQLTQYSFNNVGALTRVVDPKGQVYKFSYNALGWLIAQNDLADTTKADSAKYDEVGNPRVARTRRGDVITVTYDLAGRPTSRSGPDFPVDSMKYDPNNRWLVAWNVDSRDSLNFDAAGRVSKTFQRMNGHTWQWNYAYDIQDRLTRRDDELTQHPRILMWGVTGTLDYITGATALAAFVRNGTERLVTSRDFNIGSNTWTAYKTLNTAHLDSTHTYLPDPPGAHLSMWNAVFAYDSLLRIKTQTYGGWPVDFTYDSLSRLKTAHSGEYSYIYDAASNRLLSGEPLSNVGPGNRIVNTAGFYLSYDLNGNITSKCPTQPICGSAGYLFTWNAANTLTEVRRPSGTLLASFKYDALGRRIAKTTPTSTEWYVYDADHVVYDLDNANAVKVEYAYYPGTDQLMAVKNSLWTGIAITDPMVGTVNALFDYSGTSYRRSYGYDPFGVPSSYEPDVVTRHRMAGREYDGETGLYFMRARYYDPKLGRFLSEDPIGINGGMNQYVYAGNDPINARDPDGDRCIYISGGGIIPFAVCDMITIHGKKGTGYGGGTHLFLPRDGGDRRGGGSGRGGGGSGGGGEGAGSGTRTEGPSCFDSALIFAGSLLLDASFFFTGGISGIIRGFKAGGYALRSVTKFATAMDLSVYARGSLERAGRSIAEGYLGSKGIMGAVTVGFDAAAPTAAGDFTLKGFLRSLAPGVASWDSGKAAKAACFD